MANTQALGQSKPRANTITGGMNSFVAFSKRTRPSVTSSDHGTDTKSKGEAHSMFIWHCG